MKRLLDLVALNKQSGEFGVEIEMEGGNLPNIDDMFWKSVADHSLRNGIEYVFKKPVPLIKVEPMLRHLKKQLDENGANVKFSFRTSVHVHMNVQECSPEQIISIIYTYLLLETPLMEFCGKDRQSNRFCLRANDAEKVIDIFKDMFINPENNIIRHPIDKVRYASINVEALTKYGSLEFRGMNGNLDEGRITLWCSLLKSIKTFALEIGTPSQIYNEFIKMGAEEFFKRVLGAQGEELNYPELVRDINTSFSLSIELPFHYLESCKKPTPITPPEKVPRVKNLAAGVQRFEVNMAAPRIIMDEFAHVDEAAPVNPWIIQPVR